MTTGAILPVGAQATTGIFITFTAGPLYEVVLRQTCSIAKSDNLLYCTRTSNEGVLLRECE